MERARQLTEYRTAVVVQSVPRHMGVKGNKKADERSKEATEKADTSRSAKQFTPLAHVGFTIIGRKWKGGQELVQSRTGQASPHWKGRGMTRLLRVRPE